MKRILQFLFSIITLFAFNQTFAQTNFVPGYIIKLNGDTVRGQLDDRNWNINPAKISFKTDTEQQYTVNEIAGFGSDGDIYKRFSVSMTLYKKNITDQLVNEKPIFVNDTTVFLRLLVKSDWDLYQLTDAKDIPHFYMVQQEKAHELVYKTQLVERKGSTYVAEDNTFRTQLVGILQPEKSLESRISRARYTSVDLKSIFEKYNQSKGITTKPVSKDKFSYDFDVIAGISYASPTISGLGNLSNLEYKFDNAIQPSFGLGFTAYLPRNRKQVSLDNQLLYSAYSSTSTGTYPISSYEISSNVKLKASYIKLLTTLRYEYPNGKIRPFVGIGISNGFALSIKTSFYRQNTLYDHYSKTLPLFAQTRNYEQSLVLALGVNYNKLRFEFRNDYSNGISPYQNVSSKVTYYQFSLRYSLIKK